MRSKLASLVLVLLATAVSAQQSRPAAAPQLPPLVYVCPMPGDEAVLEEKAGKCPKCGMELTPVRLDSKFWCPTHQLVVVRDGPGKCPRDQKDLVPVTLAETWTCADKPDVKLLEPGQCGDGKARQIKYEIRAHGDHNPKHGGLFFMATDAWHHIEGTYPSPGTFRIHFYDNFTKPMKTTDFSGSVVILDAANKEIASYPLTRSRDALTMDARIPPANAGLPINAGAKIKFGAKIDEQFFNFPFSKLTTEPVAPTPAATTTSRTPAPALPQTPASTPPAVAAQAAPAPAAPATAAAQEPLILDTPLNMPPGLAEVTDETKLPTTTAGLIVELESRAKEVETLVNDGSLAQVWLPAMGTKTVALVLDGRSSTLPERQRAAVAAAVTQIVTASWEIDAYGDLGNRQKITEAYRRLASAVANLKAIYAQ